MKRRATLAALAAVAAFGLGAGCRDHGKPKAGDGSGSAGAPPVVAIDWGACETAVRGAGALPDGDRVAALITACPVCGDWHPILDWQRLSSAGGPTRLSIDQGMKACDAWCNADAHDRFLGTLDDARGVANNRAPWHYLADACKDKLSADDARERYVIAPYFALDRIVRAVGKRSPDDAKALSAITVPLPPVTVTGNGITLPPIDGATAIAGPLALSIIGAELRVAWLPRAQLGADGIALVKNAGEPYPGAVAAHPADDLRALAGATPNVAVAVLAPRAMPAAKVVAAIAAAAPTSPAAGDGPRRLAVAAKHRDDAVPIGWELPRVIGPALIPTLAKGALVIGLTADGFIGRADDGAAITRAVHIAAGPAPLAERLVAAIGERRAGTPIAIAVAPDTTVEQLANLLARLGPDGEVAIGTWAPPATIAATFDPAILEAARPAGTP